jgi:hypothetical protein
MSSRVQTHVPPESDTMDALTAICACGVGAVAQSGSEATAACGGGAARKERGDEGDAGGERRVSHVEVGAESGWGGRTM